MQGVERPDLDIGAVYLQHSDAMWGMARSMLRGDEERAKDIIQEVMLTIVAKKPTGVRNWEAYLVHSVKMRIYDLWKSAAHQHERLRLEEATPLEGERLGGDDLALDPSVVLEEAEGCIATVTEVRSALAELRSTHPVEHDVLLKAKSEGQTSKEIAAEMGVSDSRVRQHLMAARFELSKILAARGGER
jgi:RNA polymerase sigma factor (sigma-70 family)